VPRIRLHLTRHASSETVGYEVAGAQLCADAAVACLEPFRGDPRTAGAVPAAVLPAAGVAWEAVFAGDAWVGGRERRVRCERAGEALRVACAGARAFVVAGSGAWIVADPLADRGPEGVDEEVLVGPALLLALALRGTFALHAAAVRTPAGVVALVGESGAGKSTLAAAAGPGWARVADDVLPFALAAGEPAALPHYPQLKLPGGAQYHPSAPARLPLVAVCEVGAPATDGRIAVEPLSPRDATLGLIAHTVAARLFPEDLVEAHLELAAVVASQVPVLRLRYPRTLDALPSVRRALAVRLAAGAG